MHEKKKIRIKKLILLNWIFFCQIKYQYQSETRKKKKWSQSIVDNGFLEQIEWIRKLFYWLLSASRNAYCIYILFIQFIPTYEQANWVRLHFKPFIIKTHLTFISWFKYLSNSLYLFYLFVLRAYTLLYVYIANQHCHDDRPVIVRTHCPHIHVVSSKSIKYIYAMLVVVVVVVLP